MKYLIVFALTSLALTALGQKQLLLLKNNRVFHRYHAGDYVRMKLKTRDGIVHTYINNILDDAIVLSQDTVSIYDIEKTFVDASRNQRVAGMNLIVAGLVLFVADPINTSVIQDEDFEINPGVAVASGVLVAGGLALRTFKNDSQTMSYKYRLMVVKRGDPMYK